MTIRKRQGTSLIDLVISIAIIAILFGGIYLVYFSLVTAIGNVSVRTAGTSAVSNEFEMIRNLPYASVGTVGGVPSGIIPQSQNVTVGKYTFTLNTVVRNIDDPFDGTLGGNPNDTAPDDYKLVSIQATCPLCASYVSLEITTTVAPKNLESATTNGSLFIYALDADGDPIQGANVTVENASVTPSIDLTDTTNASGVLELVGTPTSTRSYQVIVTKAGYSTDQTYPVTVSNPNPVKPYATVAAQTVTSITFSIDQLSQLNVYTSNDQCVAIGNEPFSIQGSKLIGTPSDYKFSTSSATNASGSLTMPNIEWDTYTLISSDKTYDVLGTIPLDPIAISPSSTASFRFILAPAADPSLLVSVIDSATGAGISGASVTLSKTGFSKILFTDRQTITQTDWSGGQYSSESGVDPATIPGEITLLANASGTYSTSTAAWLVSNTFDLGGSSSTFYSIAWDPISEPVQTGTSSVVFQVAANNDNATWNFVGPDGTAATYFTASSSLPASLSGNRYFRYKIYLTTLNQNFTPEVDDVSFDFTADCVPPAQVLFTSLPQATYTLDVTAANYGEATTSVAVGSGAQSSTISLTHL